jgi:protein SCO1/2
MSKRLFSIFLIPLLIALSPILLAAPAITPIGDVRFEQKRGAHLPLETKLTDEYGFERPLKDYFGNGPLILVFSYFRCPNLCTLVLNGLVQSLQQLPDHLGSDYQVLSVSIDPLEKPSLALAKKLSYLARLGQAGSLQTHPQGSTQMSPGWHFLTGQEEPIKKLARSSGFHYQKDPGSRDYSHPSGFLVLTPKGVISKYFFGIQFDPQELHQALLTARSHQKSSWTEEILLYCFHYNPKFSQNGPLIIQIIRIVGGLSAFGLLGLLLFLFSGKKEKTR